MPRVENVPRDVGSLDALHEQSVELVRHARRLQQEFQELRETSQVLRKKSLQLREDCRVLRYGNRVFV
jgi:hypothetical protein